VYADSFGHQWTTYDWLREEDEKEFFTITDLEKSDLHDKLLLDAGCGGGRFLRFLASYCKEVVGLDYSIAVERAQELTKDCDNVHLMQCDINNHPFRKETFDVVISHGVLHHTPDTYRSFSQLPPVVKPGGSMYIAVFRKAFFLLRWSDSFWRSILNKLPISVLDKVCDLLSYLYYLPNAVFWKRFFWFSLQKTHEIRKCCLYDWYGPTYHHEHTVEEVKHWFEKVGFREIQYINAWPYCPANIKYAIPTWKDSFRLGQLLGVHGTKVSANYVGESAVSKTSRDRKNVPVGVQP
jgi:SAM-dependent methyltransferase